MRKAFHVADVTHHKAIDSHVNAVVADFSLTQYSETTHVLDEDRRSSALAQ